MRDVTMVLALILSMDVPTVMHAIIRHRPISMMARAHIQDARTRKLITITAMPDVITEPASAMCMAVQTATRVITRRKRILMTVVAPMRVAQIQRR